MKTLTVGGFCVLLLALIFQCCPSAAQEPPELRAPEGEESAAAQATAGGHITPSPTLTPEPTPPALGTSLQSPAPVGHTLIASNGAAITVHGMSHRGQEAADLVSSWSVVNEPPSAGKEYVVISASVGYEDGDSETLRVSQFDFRMVSQGVIIEPPLLLVEGVLEGEMFEGARIDGLLVFEVPEGSSDLVLIYTVLMDRSYYLAVQ